mmetsp:Transcript_14174/g.15409  ORF Transcript_14174/g.15409 Transcript_14174/m.15409 type:complete len:96 (+) Transcript_14174:438-725(+)
MKNFLHWQEQLMSSVGDKFYFVGRSSTPSRNNDSNRFVQKANSTLSSQSASSGRNRPEMTVMRLILLRWDWFEMTIIRLILLRFRNQSEMTVSDS